jgi:hypothetical protein
LVRFRQTKNLIQLNTPVCNYWCYQLFVNMPNSGIVTEKLAENAPSAPNFELLCTILSVVVRLH